MVNSHLCPFFSAHKHSFHICRCACVSMCAKTQAHTHTCAKNQFCLVINVLRLNFNLKKERNLSSLFSLYRFSPSLCVLLGPNLKLFAPSFIFMDMVQTACAAHNITAPSCCCFCSDSVLILRYNDASSSFILHFPS